MDLLRVFKCSMTRFTGKLLNMPHPVMLGLEQLNSSLDDKAPTNILTHIDGGAQHISAKQKFSSKSAEWMIHFGLLQRSPAR